MKFSPANGYVEIEPIKSDSIIDDDNKKFVNCGKVIKVCDDGTIKKDIFKEGYIIFFRPHGFFEIEYKGEKHYVVHVSEEFILGIINE